MPKSIITFDIDWASDDVINDSIDIMLERRMKATWFATHPTKCLERIRQNPDLFELGIHPNFLAGSSHGDNYADVLRYCVDLVPEAVSMRSHAIYHNGRILMEMARLTKIRYESNAFMPETPGLAPVKHETVSYKFVRVPFFWSDDHELSQKKPDWNMNRLADIDGLRVYLFHPIHVYLNSQNFSAYESGKATGTWKPNDYVQPGARKALLDICDLEKDSSIKMKDIEC